MTTLRIQVLFTVLTFSVGLAGPAAPAWADVIAVPGSGLEKMPPQAYASWMDSLATAPADPIPLTVTEPRPGAVLPANAAAPIISWNTEASAVLVRLQTRSVEAKAICTQNNWTPEEGIWNKLRSQALGGRIDIAVAPLGGEDGRTIMPAAVTHLVMDPNPLPAPIAYLQLPVPFRAAKHHPRAAAWRKAFVNDPAPPPVFMTNLAVCANCHAYSADGSAMLLDMDIDGDKGAFVLTQSASQVSMERANCHSWNSLPPTPPSPFSFGLFAQLSGDGRLAAATVGETSLFVMIDRNDFSQLFFPVSGQIGIFDRSRNHFERLDGTTDPAFVHTGPHFSPDGTRIAFSRAPVREDYVRAVLDKTVQNESSQTTIEALNSKYPYRFDLCTLPFPNPQKRAPRPLPGASRNGQSNYFPRYSPDGRWIVFTQAPTGLVLQPGSRLCIVPAEGGTARELACNTARMNSWHSWSPDGKWLVFSAKGARAETEIFLARMYEDGASSPSVRLHRLSAPGLACVVPEFLPGAAHQIQSARLAFSQETQIDTRNNVR